MLTIELHGLHKPSLRQEVALALSDLPCAEALVLIDACTVAKDTTQRPVNFIRIYGADYERVTYYFNIKHRLRPLNLKSQWVLCAVE